jgi:hypothetical protein
MLPTPCQVLGAGICVVLLCVKQGIGSQTYCALCAAAAAAAVAAAALLLLLTRCLCAGCSGGYSELGVQSCVDQGTGVRPQGPPGRLDLKGKNAKGLGLNL